LIGPGLSSTPATDILPVMSPYAWLYRLALDCLIEAWRHESHDVRDPRRETVWPKRSSVQLELSLVDTGTRPSEAMAGQELRERVHAALDDRCCALHPEHTDEIHATIATMDVVNRSRDATDEAIPKTLGDFRIVRKLARGGMGDIFEAVQEPLGRRVAVKTIRDDRLNTSPEIRDRFLREQTVLARLHHTHIVPIHAAVQEGRLHYFAMPYIEGAALSDIVQSARDLDPSRAGSTPTLAELAAHLSTSGNGRQGPSPASTTGSLTSGPIARSSRFSLFHPPTSAPWPASWPTPLTPSSTPTRPTSCTAT